jgi:hypothetical protein
MLAFGETRDQVSTLTGWPAVRVRKAQRAPATPTPAKAPAARR